MKSIELTFTGRIPSKKNSRNIFVDRRTGAIRNIPSKTYAEWRDRNLMELVNQMAQPLEKVDEIQMEFYMPDDRKTDLTNKAESVMDLLVDAKIIEDDCWQVVNKLYLMTPGVDKKNPRVKVWIKYF
jgi:crossover junction endodeoxyribonuclease RusA